MKDFGSKFMLKLKTIKSWESADLVDVCVYPKTTEIAMSK